MKTLKESILSDEEELLNDVDTIRELATREFIELFYTEMNDVLIKGNIITYVGTEQGFLYIQNYNESELPDVKINGFSNVSFISCPKLTTIGNVFSVIDELSIDRCPKLQHMDGLKNTEIHHIELLNVNFNTLDWTSSVRKLESLIINGAENLRTLKGCPQEMRWLSLRNCPNLEVLDDGPRKLFNFTVERCGITDLIGGPVEVTHEYECNANKRLVTLEGAPKKVKIFRCTENPRLVTLQYAPTEVVTLSCSDNKSLRSLEGGETAKKIICQDCPKITSAYKTTWRKKYKNI